jgi:hypothetical protein
MKIKVGQRFPKNYLEQILKYAKEDFLEYNKLLKNGRNI